MLMLSADLSSLLYAALNARLCIEAIAYDKIRIYAPRLPQHVLRKWQPPQLIKALLEFEPDATKNFSLSYAEELLGGGTGPVRHLGTHLSLRPSELQKMYNKLGNFLHVPSVDAQKGSAFLVEKRLAELKSFLEQLIPRLQEVLASTIDGSLAQIVEFECTVCGDIIMRNLAGLKSNPQAVCLNPNCQAEYFADCSSDPPAFILKVSYFECGKCKHPNSVENRKLAIGVTFKCSKCEALHVFVNRQWQYGLVDENGKGSEQPNE